MATGLLAQTRTAAAAASIPSTVQYVRTAGHTAVGDGGDTTYKRVGSPSTIGNFQSVDGAYWEERRGERINVLSYGADPTGATDSATAFLAAEAAMQPGDEFYTPPGATFALGQTIPINGFRSVINSQAMLKPFGAFSDYLVSMIAPGADPFIINVGIETTVKSLRMDCALQSRGLYLRQIYNSHLSNVKIWRAYGHAINCDYMMENLWFGLLISGGMKRDASWLGTETVWSSGTTYSVGNRVRVDYAAYAGGTTYAKHAFVTSASRAYRSIQDSNTGNTPASSRLHWQEVAYEYFECMIGHTNKDPHSGSNFTTNSTVTGDKYWKKIFPSEAALNLVNDTSTGVIDNQTFYGAQFRQNDHDCLIRIDQAANATPAEFIRFIGGQVHSITQEERTALGANGQTAIDHRRLIEIGYCLWSGMENMHIRSGSGNSDVTLVQIGAKCPGKVVSSLRFVGNTYTASGSGIWAFTLMPSVTGAVLNRDPLFTFFVDPSTCVSSVDYASMLEVDPIGGTYTPTVTAEDNAAAAAANGACTYIRVGDVVLVNGSITVDPTTDTTPGLLTKVGISLPIASNFTSSTQCSGTAISTASGTNQEFHGTFISDSTNDRAQLQFFLALGKSVANLGWRVQFSYQVL